MSTVETSAFLRSLCKSVNVYVIVFAIVPENLVTNCYCISDCNNAFIACRDNFDQSEELNRLLCDTQREQCETSCIKFNTFNNITTKSQQNNSVTIIASRKTNITIHKNHDPYDFQGSPRAGSRHLLGFFELMLWSVSEQPEMFKQHLDNHDIDWWRLDKRHNWLIWKSMRECKNKHDNGNPRESNSNIYHCFMKKYVEDCFDECRQYCGFYRRMVYHGRGRPYEWDGLWTMACREESLCNRQLWCDIGRQLEHIVPYC